jgi:methylamine utilization protein MauE
VSERGRARGIRWTTLLLGVLFFAQGLGKLLDVPGYTAALRRFPLVPAAAAHEVAVAWLCLELATGAALMVLGVVRGSVRALRIAAVATLLIAAAYATLAFHGYLVGADVPNCTCFGVYLAQRLGGLILIQEALMLWWTGRHLVKAA